jgi:serine/threonine-protein kinase HipA
MKNQLSIRLHGKPVGVLEQTVNGKKVFTYDNDATTPISIGMPIQGKSYGEERCEAFFGGLLPESEVTRQILGKRYGISPHNSFALLKAIGYDCAGAISCHEVAEPVISAYSVPLTGQIISEADLYQHIIELPQKPLFMNTKGLRLSLAGVQDKAAICLIDNQIAFPLHGCPTTHILKPNLLRFEGLTENEYFILKIAQRVGLSVPNVILRKIRDITFLLIERYDRRIKNNCIERVHQEDFCQALGTVSIKKYQNEGGPDLKKCFELLKATIQPAKDRNQLAHAVVFNYLVGNMDAHGKNFSLLHRASYIQLAPFYDIVCTRVYANLSSKMAMKIGSKYDANHVLTRHWQQLCDHVNYSFTAMVNLINDLGNKIKVAAAEERLLMKANGLGSTIIDKIYNFLDSNIDNTYERLR